MMKRRIFVAFTVLMAVFSLAGCGGKPQKATLVLPSNQTTGYSWEATQTNPIFTIQSEYVPDENKEGMAGVGGKETFILTPEKSGEDEITFTYAQHWEGGETGDTLTYKLVVDREKRIKVESMTGSMSGDINTVPELPEFVIE